MYRIDFNKPEHIHFIGIGGISMSGLAKILIKRGFKISGSDTLPGSICTELEGEGAYICYGHKAENITADTGCVVFTAAIKEDNPEYERAISLNIPLLSRAELLAQLMENYKYSIAVSGTHGKTSVTSMLSYILVKAGLDPTISLGGMLDLIGGNIHIGAGEIFLTEACEYKNSFLELKPYIGIILNIEEDHLDFFDNIDDIRNSFKIFINNISDNGILVINSEIKDIDELTAGFKGSVVLYGGKESDIYADNIDFDSHGIASYNITAFKDELGHVQLGVMGRHNVDNSLAAAAASLKLGIGIEDILKGLQEYRGVGRRLEFKGCIGGNINIFDDYAHHPQEIMASLSAILKYPHKRLVCVFQPHTYSRTKAFLNDFANSLAMADLVILSDIYAAREKDNKEVSSEDIVNLLLKKGVEAYYINSFDNIENFLLTNLLPEDLCITMGAGDIVKVAEHLTGN